MTEEMKNSVKEIVKSILAEQPAETKTEETIEQPVVEAQPSEDLEKAKKEKEEKEKKESKKDKKKEKEDDEDDKEDAEKCMDSKMKKSEEEQTNAEPVAKSEEATQEVSKETIELDAEEIELVKAWRAAKTEPVVEEAKEISKAMPASEDGELKKALEAQTKENESLKKSLEDQANLIKSLTDKVEKMASQPAYDKKAVTTLEPIEKSQPEPEKVSKPQILSALLDLQRAGEATSHDVSKYEATNQLSVNLQEKVKTQILKGTK